MYVCPHRFLRRQPCTTIPCFIYEKRSYISMFLLFTTIRKVVGAKASWRVAWDDPRHKAIGISCGVRCCCSWSFSSRSLLAWRGSPHRSYWGQLWRHSWLQRRHVASKKTHSGRVSNGLWRKGQMFQIWWSSAMWTWRLVYGRAAAFSRAVIGAGWEYDWTLALVRDRL